MPPEPAPPNFPPPANAFNGGWANGNAYQPPRPGRRRPRILLSGILVVAGIGAAATGGVLLRRELTREPTRSELAAAVVAEHTQRLRRLSAAEIFPAEVYYGAPGAEKSRKSGRLMAHR